MIIGVSVAIFFLLLGVVCFTFLVKG